MTRTGSSFYGTMPDLNRKPNREAVARAVRERLGHLPVTVETRDRDRSMAIDMTMHIGGARVTCNIFLDPGDRCFLTHWVARDCRFGPDWENVTGWDSVNLHHRAKATGTNMTVSEMLAELAQGFAMLDTGQGLERTDATRERERKLIDLRAAAPLRGPATGSAGLAGLGLFDPGLGL